MFGTHAMMSLEPETALTAFLDAELEIRHFGQWAYCGRLGTGSSALQTMRGAVKDPQR